MAKAPTTGPIEVLILCDCYYGKSGEVVTLDPDQVANGLDSGNIDTNPAAVENAKAQ